MYCEIQELEGEPVECNLSELYEQINDTIDISQSDPWDMDEQVALTLDYETNYKLGDLKRIINYYNDGGKIIQPISRKKCDAIKSLVEFELNKLNEEIVSRRRTLWFYIKEISEDKHLSKYLILN